VARHRIAVALLVAEPLATEIDGLRRALGADERELVPPHITLISPINLRDKELLAGLDVVRRSAEQVTPLSVTLGPATTFAPVTPTVHLAVSGEDLPALHSLRSAMVAMAPLHRPDPFDYVPHVTVAQELDPPDRIAPAVDALSSWKPFADAPLAASAVVGRGGLEVELTVTARPEPEGAALLAVDGAGAGEGRPFAVNARLGERVAGAAWGWTSGSVAIIADLAVADAHRNKGIGRKVLAAVESEAAKRNCDVLIIAAPGGGPAAALLQGAGWQAAGDAVADCRRLWRRAL
jgi:GNAT superfamily N-acetyltransferase